MLSLLYNLSFIRKLFMKKTVNHDLVVIKVLVSPGLREDSLK